MRNYLYAWNNSEDQYLILSGVLFSDFVPYLLNRTGIVLLKHKYQEAQNDFRSRFDIACSSDLPDLAKDNIYSYGDFCWADFEGDGYPTLTPTQVAELLYFAHTGAVLNKNLITGLRNQFLCFAHDDGWYLKLYYTDWKHAERLLFATLDNTEFDQNLPDLINRIRSSDEAVWITGGLSFECQQTHNIDGVIETMMATVGPNKIITS